MDTATRTPERHRELFQVKQGHVYLFRYRKGQEDAVADVMARWASDPELGFSWGDASALGDELRGEDPLGPAKGIGWGLVLSVVFWSGVAAAIGGWR